MKFIDEIASLSTATLFAFTVLIFTSTGRAVGSQVTNRMLLLLALIYLAILNIILFREPLLFSAGGFRWLWLTLSGIIGLSLGHAAFQGEAASTLHEVRGKPRILGLLALRAFMGSVLGVSFSLLAIQHAEINVASTLIP